MTEIIIKALVLLGPFRSVLTSALCTRPNFLNSRSKMSNIRPRPYFRKCRPYAISLRHIFTPYQFIIFRFLKVLIFKFHYYQKLDLDIKQFPKLRKIKKNWLSRTAKYQNLEYQNFRALRQSERRKG